MSDDARATVVVDPEQPAAAADDQSSGPSNDASPAAAVASDASPRAAGESSRAPAGSVLSDLHAEQARLCDTVLVMPVGRSDLLASRYRFVDDDELEDIAKRIKQSLKAQEVARRRGEHDDAGVQIAALTLAVACEELLWVGGNDDKPVALVDALTADGIDTHGTSPMRYDQRTAAILGLEVPSDASGVDIVIEMHTWRGRDGRSTRIPLSSASERYSAWLTEQKADALQELFEGI